MSNSYEQDLEQKEGQESFKESRISIPILQYFWQASPLAGNKTKSIHKFLRKVSVLEHLSDYELRLFSQYLHLRNFTSGEVIFKEGDGGYGFYLIFSGGIDIFVNRRNVKEKNEETEHITLIGQYEYFGEFALLEEKNIRNATAIARENTTLLGFFKPDLDEMIERHPVVAAKLLQAISLIVAKRFISATNELKLLQEKLRQMTDENKPQI